jgi:hypothetical protein
LAHRRFEKFFPLQLAQLFPGRLNIHRLPIVDFNAVEGLDNATTTLFEDDLKVNRVNSAFWLQKVSILSSPFSSPWETVS